MKQCHHFDYPSFFLRLHLILVTHIHILRSLHRRSMLLHLATIAGGGGQGPGLEQAYRPEVFIDS